MGLIKFTVKGAVFILILYIVVIIIDQDVEAARQTVEVVQTLSGAIPISSLSNLPEGTIPLVLVTIGVLYLINNRG